MECLTVREFVGIDDNVHLLSSVIHPGRTLGRLQTIMERLLEGVSYEAPDCGKKQLVIDKAVQLHGGDGVKKGVKVEELYRDIRALRIYEGASDVQRVVIARQVIADHQGS